MGRNCYTIDQDISHLVDQTNTVLRCTCECNSQIVDRKATERPLRPNIRTARLTQNIPSSYRSGSHPTLADSSKQLAHHVMDMNSPKDTHNLQGPSKSMRKDPWEAFPGKLKWR